MRRVERALVAEYRELVRTALDRLTPRQRRRRRGTRGPARPDPRVRGHQARPGRRVPRTRAESVGEPLNPQESS
ncbi:hypothetical protein [Nonomuraea salmonea]|uniref:hypothetical protein n=1 Tax=Nonomuraea salmonea TaxID=46181 RepID=UPI0031E5025C